MIFCLPIDLGIMRIGENAVCCFLCPDTTFFKLKQWRFLISVMLVFIGKLSNDFLKKMPKNSFRLGKVFISDAEQLKWNKVFDSLKNRPTLP